MGTSVWGAGSEDPNTGLVWNGIGNPSPSLGLPGDFYIDTFNWKISGPKTILGWPTPVDLIGAEGIVGPQGLPGPIGPQGIQGIPGPTGLRGVNGDKGDKGDPGDNGTLINVASGDPNPIMGDIGDLYLDQDNGNLWGPKTAVLGWGDAPIGSFKGPKGDKGDSGDVTIISGLIQAGTGIVITGSGNFGSPYVISVDPSLIARIEALEASLLP